MTKKAEVILRLFSILYILITIKSGTNQFTFLFSRLFCCLSSFLYCWEEYLAAICQASVNYNNTGSLCYTSSYNKLWRPTRLFHPRPAWITCQNQGVNCTFSYSHGIFQGSYVDLEIHHPEHIEVTQYAREEGGGASLYSPQNKQTNNSSRLVIGDS